MNESNLSLRKKLLLIINPVSGKRAVIRYVPQIIRCFMDAGYRVTAMVTAAHGDASDFARLYGAEHDLIVCTGGDGTLNETLCGLADADLHVPIGYIPCGSTNDFALSRHLSPDIPAAAEAIAHGTIRRFDVGRFDRHYFSYVAAFGAFSWLSYTTDQNLKNVLGHTAYILDGIKDLPKVRPLRMKVTADGRIFEGDYIFGAIANSTSIAGTIQLPESEVDTCDGLFELLLIKNPRTLAEFSDTVQAVINQDYGSDRLVFLHASDILCESPEMIEWTVDGEFPGIYSHVHITPMPGFLQLMS